MVNELMTTRDLQDFLQVDRTTIYSMLSDGRLPGFRIGGQWRFSRRDIESWLEEQRAHPTPLPDRPSPDVLPTDCIQSMQHLFAEAMDVGVIVTQLDGSAMTETSNSCDFCNLVLGSAEGAARCTGSWEALARQKERQPQLHRCHAGLLYSRARIEVADEFVAMVFAGQAIMDGGLEDLTTRLDKLGKECGLNPAELKAALPSAHSLDQARAEQLMRLLGLMGQTLSSIGQDRLLLLRKLRRIAEVTSF
jgi:excisionase family DNA binding protein